MSANSLVFSLEMVTITAMYYFAWNVDSVLTNTTDSRFKSLLERRTAWLLINVTPREGLFLDTTVSMTGNKEVEDLIEEKVVDFYMSMSSGQPKRQGKIAVLFYEKRLKNNWWQFSKSEELICWEQWAITITVVEPQSEQEKQKIRKSMERQLNQNLIKILNIINEHKEHIPSITTTEGNPFPYQIAILGSSESWAAMIKRLIVTDAPVDANGGVTSAGGGGGGSEGSTATGTRTSN
ncbi:hypothetical protein BGW37DRAFT_523280 [Umbelopsis sp. PMI_123]|nr:hypothetical protein BGW37DRAFT_523280 [Umbelopsis sp. PMI_123]